MRFRKHSLGDRRAIVVTTAHKEVCCKRFRHLIMIAKDVPRVVHPLDYLRSRHGGLYRVLNLRARGKAASKAILKADSMAESKAITGYVYSNRDFLEVGIVALL